MSQTEMFRRVKSLQSQIAIAQVTLRNEKMDLKSRVKLQKELEDTYSQLNVLVYMNNNLLIEETA